MIADFELRADELAPHRFVTFGDIIGLVICRTEAIQASVLVVFHPVYGIKLTHCTYYRPDPLTPNGEYQKLFVEACDCAALFGASR